MTGLTLFGGAVGICVGTVALSSLLKAFGKGHLDAHLSAIAELAMLGITMGGIYLVLHMIMTIFGVNIPVGWEAIDKLFTMNLPGKWW